ncbi:MAG TPA: hypothetical protein VH112_00780 [Acidimicrobiales bacterium]|nr:hypothetical protein [Acidimicrobiales bacterium]
MRRRGATLLFATTLSAYAAVAGWGMHPAGAAAPDQQGWWTALNPGSLPQLGQSVPAPTQPGVPAKGLLIEGPGGPAAGGTASRAPAGGKSSAPLAYAGLVYDLPTGATATTLTLTVAANSASTPTAKLELCPLVKPDLNPEQGGPSADAPPYDCTHNVSAGPNSVGKTYQFQVSNLVTNGSLGVAILPSSPTDRVVLDQPDDQSLAEQAAAAGSGAQAPSSSSGTTPDSPAGTSIPEALPTVGISPDLGPPAPTVGSPTAPAASAPGTTPARSAGAIPVLGSLAGDNASPLTVALVMAGLLGGATLWFVAGRRRSAEDEVAEVAITH